MNDVLSRTSLIEYGMGGFYDDLNSDLELSVNCKKKEVDHFKKSFAFFETEHLIVSLEIIIYLERTGSKYHRWNCQVSKR